MILFVAILASLTAFLKPKFGILILVGILFMSAFWEREVGGFTLNRLIGIFCILGMIKDYASGKNINIKVDSFDILFFGYLLTICISIFINGFYDDTISKIMNPIMGYLLYKLITFNFNCLYDFRHLLLIVFIVPMVYIPVVFEASLSADYYRGDLEDNANKVAEYLFMSVLACIAYNYNSKVKINTFFTFIYVVLGTLCMYLTGSRTMLISIPFILMLYLIVYNKKNSLIKPLIIVTGSFFLLLFINYIASFLNLAAFERITGFLSSLSRADLAFSTIKSEERFILWDVGIKMLLDNPLFGVGFGGYRDNRRSFEIYGGMAHNSYIDILSETGIIGFLFAFSMIYLTYKRLNRIKRFTTSIIDHNYVNLFIIFFISFFAVWVSLHHKSISRSMFLIFAICNALYYIAKNNYLSKKLNDIK